MANDLRFVESVIDRLRSFGVDVWLAGGWAEELHGMIDPRQHHDVDLLVRGDSFEIVDRFLGQDGVTEIAEKRFAHKRAFQVNEVMVELILIRPRPGSRDPRRSDPQRSCAILPGVRGGTAQPRRGSCDLITTFWGDDDYHWPADTFRDESGNPRLASITALRWYRNNRPPTRSTRAKAAT